jgi:hypothetical protein
MPKHTSTSTSTSTSAAKMHNPLVLYVRKTHASKLGPIAATYHHPATCPNSCPLKYKRDKRGRIMRDKLGRPRLGPCFGNGVRVRGQWMRTTGKHCQKNVKSWSRWVREDVPQLERGELLRAGIAGDQPGRGETLDGAALGMLVDACIAGELVAWGYSHKAPGHGENAAAIAAANRSPHFCLNLSADDLAEADQLAALGIGPVAVTVSSDHPAASRTAQGRPVNVCQAQTLGRTCATCGNGRPWCARADRTFVVALRAHGQGRKALDARLADQLPILS